MNKGDNSVGLRELLVYGKKTFKITVKADAKITFGPWSPPSKDRNNYDRIDGGASGTLRIYSGTNVIAVFSGVSGYRDMSLGYSELVAREEGASIWNSDENGYEREDKHSQRRQWVEDPIKITAPKRPARKGAGK